MNFQSGGLFFSLCIHTHTEYMYVCVYLSYTYMHYIYILSNLAIPHSWQIMDSVPQTECIWCRSVSLEPEAGTWISNGCCLWGAVMHYWRYQQKQL
jgi:hypothetical protein